MNMPVIVTKWRCSSRKRLKFYRDGSMQLPEGYDPIYQKEGD